MANAKSLNANKVSNLAWSTITTLEEAAESGLFNKQALARLFDAVVKYRSYANAHEEHTPGYLTYNDAPLATSCYAADGVEADFHAFGIGFYTFFFTTCII